MIYYLGFPLLSKLSALVRRLYSYLEYNRRNIKWKRKIDKLLKLKGSKKLSKYQIERINELYSNLKVRKVNKDWHRLYYSCNNIFSEMYVPENLFYLRIEPSLNRGEFVTALSDKNLLKKLLPEIRKPNTVISNVNGTFYTNDDVIDLETAIDVCLRHEMLILKPTVDTGGGKNVSLLDVNQSTRESFRDLFKEYHLDFTVQEVVRQHSKMSMLNDSSLNTVRVMSYFNKNKVQVLSAIVRMGRKGSVTDNATTGGLCCGIEADGKLKNVAYDNNRVETFRTTDEGLRFTNLELPFMEKIYKSVVELHQELSYFKLVSWDLAIDVNGEVVLIEFNVKGQEINFHQINNGPVLSKILTDQLNGNLDLVLGHDYSFIF